MSYPINHTKERILPPLWIIVTALVIFIIWVLIQLKEIVVLLVVGYSIAYVIDPALCFLERKKISRSFGLFVIFSAAIISILVLTLTAWPTLSREYAVLSEKLPEYVDTAKAKFFPQIEKFLPKTIMEKTGDALSFSVPGVSGEAAQKLGSGIMKALVQGYSITLTLINIALLPFIVVYLALDFHGMHSRFLNAFPILMRKKISNIVKEIDRYVSAFIRGQLLVGLINSCFYLIGLGFIGVELWFLLAIISGLGSIVPYVGFIIGIVLSSIMALVTFGDLSHLLQVWALYAAVQAIEGTFTVPKIIGHKVGLSPLTVTLAIFAGGSLFGLLGVFLAVPGAAVIRVLGRHFGKWVLEQR